MYFQSQSPCNIGDEVKQQEKLKKTCNIFLAFKTVSLHFYGLWVAGLSLLGVFTGDIAKKRF
jgi:hypothetical protein